MRLFAWFLMTKKGSSLLGIILKMFLLAFLIGGLFQGCETVYRSVSGGNPSFVYQMLFPEVEIDLVEAERVRKRLEAEN